MFAAMRSTRAIVSLSSLSGRVKNCGACGTIAPPSTAPTGSTPIAPDSDIGHPWA